MHIRIGGSSDRSPVGSYAVMVEIC